MSNGHIGTLRTTVNVTAIIASVILTALAIISFFLIRLVNEFDKRGGEVKANTANISELKGTLRTLDERTGQMDRRAERMDQKMDKIWAELRK